jgi:hypothetical protein
MAIVKRKNAKTGGVYYFNTTTKKFASEAEYKRTKSAPIAKFKARKGAPSENTCSIYGKELKVKGTSASGRGLVKCPPKFPETRTTQRKAMFANIAARAKRGK